MNIRLIAVPALLAGITLAGCVTTPNAPYNPGYNPGYGSTQPYRPADNRCYDCGIVQRIDAQQRGNTVPNATGAVLGGIVGAVAGRAIADNHTDSTGRKNTATAAGAIGGALAGNAIQNNVQSKDSYTLQVRMDNGQVVSVTQNDLNGVREGSYVSVANGRATLR